MYDRIKNYVREKHMLSQADHVIIGLSGGADSVCLLDVLAKMREEYSLKITAVHVNHGLRGEEAEFDEAYAKTLCSSYEIPLKAYHVDVNAFAREQCISTEEAGREARRKVFGEVMCQEGATRIALAHHKNDNAETVILNMARGTGLKGLGGIRPVNGPYIRPLLCVERYEIEAYLREKGIAYCEDKTNAQDDYTRNRIRNHIIPCLEHKINEKSVVHLADLAGQMEELYDYVDGQTSEYYGKCVSELAGQAVICKEPYLEVPEAIKPYLIRKALVYVSGKEKNIEQIHITEIKKLMDKQVGRQLSLPYRMYAKRCYEGIRIKGKETAAKLKEDNSQEIAKPQMSFRIFEYKGNVEGFPENPYTKWFDYDIIKNTVEIRKRRTGDYITIDQQGNKQKIKKYLINAKVPSDQRDRLLLVADGNEIMWIVGYRQNQRYQVTGNTKRVIEIKIDRKTIGGMQYARED